MTRLRDERGAALVTAMLVTVLIGALGIVGLIAADRFQRGTGDERVRETTLQLAEAALSAQVIPLNAVWPSSATLAIPSACTSAATVARCPSPASVAASFQQTPADTGTWRVEVRDDIYSSGTDERYVYDDLTSKPSWDSNGNGRLWIRAEATVQGRRRSVVSLVRREAVRVPLPRASVISGGVRTANNGNKVLIDTLGCSAKIATPAQGCAANQPGAVMTRCEPPETPTTGDACLSARAGQISPIVQARYDGAVVSGDLVAMLKSTAIAENNYFTGCPSAAVLTQPARLGATIYIDAAGATCSYTQNHAFNSATKPGRLVIERGRLVLGGSVRFYGLVLALNGLTPPADSGDVVTISGSATVQGAVYIEGAGKLLVGDSGYNLIFDERALADVTSWSLAGLEHNSFRELTRQEYPGT